MGQSTDLKHYLTNLRSENLKMGDIKKMAKEIKQDHDLALELWSEGGYFPRLLSVLILDKKLLTEELLENLARDMESHDDTQRNQITDWLMANQLTKDKKTIALMLHWENHKHPIMRRIFWYYQARLRWTGKNPLENTQQLISTLKGKMANEVPEVQWTMNFLAGWIGVYEDEYQEELIQFGKELGLYKDEKVAKGCTPSYLPEFIRIEYEKRQD
jgi:3-methyladenine DNA glycosylase AlkD